MNNDLLPNSVLEPGYPRRVSVETARKWLHELGFDILQLSKGVFIDGHERSDVVESRVKFLRTMTEYGFLRPDNAPTEEAAKALPAYVPHMSKEEGEKRMRAYNTSEDTPILWGEKGKLPIKPKGRGSSIMVSEFIEEQDGYLALSDQQYKFEVAHNERQDIGKSALKILKIGEQQEGYWNSERFMKQVAEAVKIAEVKYPPSQGYHHIWCFDHSCGHTAYAENALIASKMNKGPVSTTSMTTYSFHNKTPKIYVEQVKNISFFSNNCSRYHTEEVRQAPAHAPCGPSFNCMFDIPRLLYVSRDTLCICKLAILVHTPLRKLVLVAA